MATHRQFLCRSNYQHCSRCATKITPGETLRGKPPTDEPLVGWTDACCFPNCKQAVKDRAARTTPYPEVDLSPQDHSFRNRYPNNYCCICGGEIKIGARMTSTKHDVPEGHRAWFNKRHERCSLAVRISNKARAARYRSAAIVALKREEGNDRADELLKEENEGGDVAKTVKKEQGEGDAARVVKKERGEGGVARVVKKEEGQGDSARVVKKEQGEGASASAVKKEGGGSAVPKAVKKDPGEDGGGAGIPEEMEDGRQRGTRTAMDVPLKKEDGLGDPSSDPASTPPRKRPRTDGRPPSSGEGASDTINTASTNGNEGPESDPCSEPSTSRPRHNPDAAAEEEETRAARVGVAGTAPGSGGGTTVPSITAPAAPVKAIKSSARGGSGLESDGGGIARNLAESEGWVEAYSSSPGTLKSALLPAKVEL